MWLEALHPLALYAHAGMGSVSIDQTCAQDVTKEGVKVGMA